MPAGGNPATIAAPQDGWRATVQGKFDQFSGKHFDIIFDGDSITNRWQSTGLEIWNKRYAGIAADFGIEGDRVQNVLWRLDKGQVDGMDPKVVVLMIGTNNSGDNTAAQIADGIKVLVAEYEKRCPRAHIILMGVFPRDPNSMGTGRQKVAAVNSQVASLENGKQVSYVDISSQMIGPNGVIAPEMMPDYLHPGIKGYRIWADAIQPIIDRFVPPKGGSPAAVAAIVPATGNTALITFSGLYDSPSTEPLQVEIPASYQPLRDPSPRTVPADGKSFHVTMAWEHAFASNRGANPGVHDHTGDDQSDDKSLGGGVLFGIHPFSVSFDQPVEIPSLFWTYYVGGGGAPLVGKISAYRNAADTTAVKSVEINYQDEQGYVWREITGFTGLRISKLAFDPGDGSDERLHALNIDDITVRAETDRRR